MEFGDGTGSVAGSDSFFVDSHPLGSWNGKNQNCRRVTRPKKASRYYNSSSICMKFRLRLKSLRSVAM